VSQSCFKREQLGSCLHCADKQLMSSEDDYLNWIKKHEATWDALLENRSIGRIAVAVTPSKERVEACKERAADLVSDEAVTKPPGWTEKWRDALVGDVARLLAGLKLSGDWLPALNVPRFVHGQSQGICDLFGAEVEEQVDGLRYVHPLRPEPSFVDGIDPKPAETSMYWGAVEWIRYARAATDGRFEFRGPVMTSAFDTANYLLGTTVLMEWVYAQPETLHRLLEKLTAVIIEMLSALREAAGSSLHGDALSCMRGAFCLCSECRSLVSKGVYEEFEAPYLRKIGEALGPFGIHSCGSWERTVESAIDDPNLRAMAGQIRENDLEELCSIAGGRMTFSIGRSVNVHSRYMWPDLRSFLEFVVQTAPPGQPLEISLSEDDFGLWEELTG